MASMKYHKDCKRWRVFWHVTLPNGEVDKGSKSFKEKKDAQAFKDLVEKKEKRLKQAVILEVPYFEEAVEEWKDYLNRYSPKTKDLYVQCMDAFVKYLGDSMSLISDLSTNMVNSYINHMMSEGKVNRTINNTLSVIKNLCNYAEENYGVPSQARCIKKLDEDPPNAKFMESEEYELVLEKADPIAVPWIIFLGNTGLRASEFVNIRWKDYNSKQKTITVVGKGRKRRTIGLNAMAFEVLENAKGGREIKASDHVFLRKDGKPLNRHTPFNYIEKACLAAGLEGKGPHSLRHFFATQLLLKGVAIFKVSKVLGHSSVTTTEKRYAHILSSDLTDVTSVLE